MTPLKDILNIAMPKIPLELQEEAKQDESYAFTGCIDMIVALNLDANVFWQDEEEINSEMQTQPQEAEEVHKKIINDILLLEDGTLLSTSYDYTLKLSKIIFNDKK